MSKQDYILKKHVKADSAADALALDGQTPVHEVFMLSDKRVDGPLADGIGFRTIEPEVNDPSDHTPEFGNRTVSTPHS